MLVTMRTQIGGFRNGSPWPEPGGTIDVPEHEALGLIAQRYAIAAEERHDDPSTGDDDDPSTEDSDGPSTEDSDDPSTGDEWFDTAEEEVIDAPAEPRRRRAKA
jgi:hypothetical protein